MLLKSKILDFETLSRVHVYCIEYVSYRQGPYRKRIVSAAYRIVPALISTDSKTVSMKYKCVLVHQYLSYTDS